MSLAVQRNTGLNNRLIFDLCHFYTSKHEYVSQRVDTDSGVFTAHRAA